MKDATIIVTFGLPYAWSEEDTDRTGLQPAKGVSSYLVGLGFNRELKALAGHFGLDLHHWGVSVHEQENTS